MIRMEFSLLGPLECRVRGESVPLGRPQARAVLAVLLLERGRVVTLDRLSQLLWEGRPPPAARSTIQSHISRLRGVLRAAGAERYGVRLLSHGTGYRLEAPTEAVDLARFQTLLGEARDQPDPAARAAGLRAALALCRGPALADLVGPIRSRLAPALDELTAQVHEEAAELELSLGRHRELIGELAALVARYPLRERPVSLLMLAQYRSGRQADALATYRAARQRLVDQLGIEPGAELRELEQAILAQDLALRLPASAVPLVDRPQVTWRGPRSRLTSIVGRERELTELSLLLADHRLVTVVGIGGVGKTTLALHLAESLPASRVRAVTVLPLAPVWGEDEAVLALGAILEVRGATVRELLAACAAALARQPQLLVLDNCEHLTAAAAGLVRKLLAASSDLRVLATSREPLGLSEEMVWRLEPLPVPAGEPAKLTESAAVKLFLRRARETDRTFTHDPSNLAAAARIARAVDGLPLALELAAGRLRSFAAPDLADQLERHLERDLGLLATDRHQADPRHTAVTSTLDWSYRLLTSEQQRLLTRLSVFRGGFTAAAAQAVCGGRPLHPDRVPDLLVSLVERSLVQPYDVAQGRYRLLEVVRSDAGQRLVASGEADAMAGRHLAHWLGLARANDRRPHDDRIAGLLALLPELENLRAALDHGYATGRVGEAVELTGLLFDLWSVHDQSMAEGDHWLSRAEPHLAACPPELRALMLFNRGVMLAHRHDYRAGYPLVRLAAEAAGNPGQRAEAAIGAVRAAVRLLLPDAPAQAEQEFARWSTADDPHLLLHAMAMRGEALLVWGRYRQALELCDRYAAEAAASSPADEIRYHVVRCLAALGCRDLQLADAAAGALRRALERPGSYLAFATPAQALGLHALIRQPDDMAIASLAGLIRTADVLHLPSSSPAYALRILLAEARRRSGQPTAARALLAQALGDAAGRSNYMDSLPGVVGAALLAADLGDWAEASRLAGGWDRTRRQLGLPAPLGFAEPVAEVFGLDPAAGPLPDGPARAGAAVTASAVAVGAGAVRPTPPDAAEPAVARLIAEAYAWAAGATDP